MHGICSVHPILDFITLIIQYQTPYPESLETKTFWILGFSGFWIFMQKNFNTGKINNKNYMLRYALSTKLYKIKFFCFQMHQLKLFLFM
jgi:hypothetical protein